MAGDSGKMTSSTDGLTFTNVSNPFSGTIYGIAENTDTNAMFVAVGSGGKIMYSPDGVSWTMTSSGVAVDLFCIVYEYDQFFAAGAGGTMLRSEDGISWTSYNNSAFGANTIYAMTLTSSVLFAAGQGGIVASSRDGVTWEEKIFPDSGFDFRAASGNAVAGTRGAVGIINTGTPNLPSVGAAKYYIKAR